MTIKKRLTTTGLFLVAFTLLVIASLLLGMVQVRQAVDKGKRAGQIARGAAELNVLARAYAFSPTERPIRQWKERSDSLAKLLAQGAQKDRSDKVVFERLIETQASAERIFVEVVAVFGGLSATPEPLRQLRRESGERLVTQLISKTQAMQYSAYLMDRNSEAQIDGAQRRAFFLILVLTLLLLGILAVASLRLYRGIVRPLRGLEEAAGRVAAGDLGFAAPETDDEVGVLARAFNRMSDSLRYSYANLSREIVERRQAQDALQLAHIELEERVAQRTAALSQKTGELQETNKELESFAYTISHDLRAPLRAVNSFAHTLADREASCLSDDGKRRLAIIEANAVKMGQLIDDLLMFSRAGRTALNLTEIDMNALLGEVLDDLKLPDPEKRLGVHAAPLPAAYGDPALIRVVLVNLLSNAVKFTRNRPDPRIEVGGVERNGELLYYVKDNGVGFDMKYYTRLFGVFERLVTDQEFEGTGVGLAIVHRLVTRHGGRVWAEAKPGEGADFYFTLPQKG